MKGLHNGKAAVGRKGVDALTVKIRLLPPEYEVCDIPVTLHDDRVEAGTRSTRAGLCV